MYMGLATGRRSFPENVALAGIETKQPALVAVLRSRLQEDAALADNRRRMPNAGNGSFPQDILLRPLDRHLLVLGDASAIGAAKTRPIAGTRQAAGWQQNYKREPETPNVR